MDSYLDLEKNLYILGNDNGEIFRIINNRFIEMKLTQKLDQ